MGYVLHYNPTMGKKQHNYRAMLARNLRHLRGDQNQENFARKLSISQSTLARIESEQQNITIDMLELMCKRLKCSPNDLFIDSN